MKPLLLLLKNPGILFSRDFFPWIFHPSVSRDFEPGIFCDIITHKYIKMSEKGLRIFFTNLRRISTYTKMLLHRHNPWPRIWKKEEKFPYISPLKIDFYIYSGSRFYFIKGSQVKISKKSSLVTQWLIHCIPKICH